MLITSSSRHVVIMVTTITTRSRSSQEINTSQQTTIPARKKISPNVTKGKKQPITNTNNNSDSTEPETNIPTGTQLSSPLRLSPSPSRSMIPTPTKTNRQPTNPSSPIDTHSRTPSDTSDPIQRPKTSYNHNWWKEASDAANTLFKLVKNNYHLGEAGDSLPEIQEITGHLVKTLQLLPIATQYTPPTTPHHNEHTHQSSDEIKEISSRLRSQEILLKSIHDSLNKPTPYPPSFAQVTRNPRPTKPTQTPKQPLRYVVNFKGKPLPHAERLSSERAMRKINDQYLSLTPPPNLLVLGVTCKPNGNYVVSYSNSSSETDAESHKQILLTTLAPNHPAADAIRDIPWTRVLVHNITLKDDNFMNRSEEDINTALKLNPILKDVQITQPARWILPPERLENKRASSISFSFIDKPTSIIPALLSEPFHMHGSKVRVELWQNIPKFAQCKRCWKVTHDTQNCKAVNPRCRKCGKTGTEDKHDEHCSECKRLPSSDLPCSHISCANCHAHDHCADDPKCAKIQKGLPKMAPKRGLNCQTSRQPPRFSQ